jgi:hypothetical protein
MFKEKISNFYKSMINNYGVSNEWFAHTKDLLR